MKDAMKNTGEQKIVVSIIVPNYDYARYLQKRIDSILDQTYGHFELILLDDASTDNSLQILTDYATHPKVTHLITNKKNSNSTFNQWKKGIALAKGEFIWIAESDDFADVHFLENLLPHFADPEVVLTHCGSVYIDEVGQVIDNPIEAKNRGNASFLKNGKEEIQDHLVIHNSIVNASAIIYRKSTLEQIKFPDDFQFCGDWWINVEMLSRGKYYYESTSLNYYRISPSGVTFRHDQLSRERLRYREYIATIHQACSYLSSEKCISVKKHSWIPYEWYAMRKQFVSQLAYYFPPFPLSLTLIFYYLIVKRIFNEK